MSKEIIDVTKQNLSQVPASRGSNPIEWIVIHYLGVPNADNENLYGGGYGGHYYVSRAGKIYKAADPRTAVVWHCGGDLQGSGGHAYHRICTNYNSIGIENGVCYTEDVKSASGDSDKWYFTQETQESLVWLVSQLMDEYGIDIDHVIRHYDVTGKICPNPYVKNNSLRTSWTWSEFKERLSNYRKDGTTTMGYTNSPLVSYTCLSPNHSGLRKPANGRIDWIIPHCVVGHASLSGLGSVFLPTSRQASSNYGIDDNGNVGMYVEEKNRSWCSSSSYADNRGVTIEVASDTTHPYAVTNGAWNGLINLCVDICKRNGCNKLLWLGGTGSNEKDKANLMNYTPKAGEMVLGAHRYWAAKSCPGDFMYNKFGELAKAVTARLGGASTTPSTPSQPAENTNFPKCPFLVTVIIDDLNYRSEGSMNGTVKGQTGKGVFTIVEVNSGGWGRLKSGVGWIYLKNPEYCTIGKTVQTEAPKPSVPSTPATKGLQATELKSLSDADAIKKVGPLATADQKKSGILASVTLAQFILESGYGKSELAQNANNVFGMKKSLSGNTWSGSSWDGKSIYTKKTGEQNPDGSYITITADFRKYPCVEDSIADHSAYLNGAMNGSKKRYEGVKGCTDYKKAIQLIKDGGYATSLTYVDKLCDIVKRWNLTQYDVKTEEAPAVQTPVATEDACRNAVVKVMQSWLGKKESDGSFKSIIDRYNAGLAEAVKTHGTRNVKMDYSWAWCACASSAAAMQANMARYYPIEISCYYIIEIAKKEGTWVEDDAYVPKPADWILYDWDDSGSGQNTGSPDHVGVVESCDGKNITVIEGNASNMVKRRTIAVNGRYIRGFVVPKFDGATPAPKPEPQPEPEVKYYRVRKTWSDAKSQVGAYKVYKNAVNKADEMGGEYAVFDWSGKEVYRKKKAFEPYLVRISIDDLNMRQGPGTNYKSNGYTGKGVFTIVEESEGHGASLWGKLKSGAGWVSLDYCTKL